MDTLQKAEAISNDIIALRRRLHQLPEIGLRLPQTVKIITDELDRLGIPWRRINDSYDGIVAEINRGQGKTAVFRADIDGLPIEEQTGLDYAAANGAMHACGHDCHAAILLGAARLFAEDDSFRGTARFIFQPAEESVGAARRMCEDGAMDKADAFFAVHVGNMVDEPSGRLIITEGAVMASRDSFTITVTGKGCHGATPAAGKDPIVISAYIITALQTMVSREINGNDSAVLT
ncbi:MAG: M20 family metallopeptidase, partial [Oscillospiraceae bacterium]